MPQCSLDTGSRGGYYLAPSGTATRWAFSAPPSVWERLWEGARKRLPWEIGRLRHPSMCLRQSTEEAQKRGSTAPPSCPASGIATWSRRAFGMRTPGQMIPFFWMPRAHTCQGSQHLLPCLTFSLCKLFGSRAMSPLHLSRLTSLSASPHTVWTGLHPVETFLHFSSFKLLLTLPPLLSLLLGPSVAVLLVFQIPVPRYHYHQTSQSLLAKISGDLLCILIVFCLGLCHRYNSCLCFCGPRL